MKDLSEEVFCLQYELKALAEITLRNESERWIPGFLHQTTEYDHQKRYELAANYVKNKTVLDIACGAGSGSYFLAETGNAKSVTGCDINEDAVRYAKYRNAHPLVNFQVSNAETYLVPDAFDIVISFETIEHLKKYDLFLKNMAASLQREGLLIVSTPISSRSLDTNPDNPYHIQEWGFKAFREEVSKYFSIIETYVQLYYKPKPVEVKHDLFSRISRYAQRTFNKKTTSGTENNVGNFSVLEKFINQYNIDELGSTRIGYQILITRKNA